jgi:hypothetical protein
MARSRKRTKPDLAAAEKFGMEEVRAEQQGNMKSARSFGKSEARARTGSTSARPRQPGLVSAAGSRMWEIAIDYPAAPPPVVVKLFDGLDIASDTYRDRVLATRPQAILPFNLSVYLNGNGIQSPGAGTLEGVNEFMFATWLSQLYSQIVRNYQASSGRSIRDTFLDTPGAPGAIGSLMIWIENYSTTYMLLRQLEGWLAIGNFNETSAAISGTIDQQRWRLIENLRRLLAYRVPAKWNRLLDMFCGPKIDDFTGCIYSMGWGLTATVFDMTQPATINAMFTTIEGNLGSLAMPNLPANNNDYQRIANAFAFAYGREPLPGPKHASHNLNEMAMVKCMAVTMNDAGLNKTFTWPNLNAATAPVTSVPIILPYNGEDTEWMFTLLRPVITSNDPVAGVANTGLASQIGLIGNQLLSTSGTSFVYHPNNQSAATALVESQGAAFGIAGMGALGNLWWAPQASTEATNYANDNRDYYGWKVVHAQYNVLLDQTLRALEDIWLGPVQ